MQYVALFRGINVGGKNIVKMADLKKLFADLGFTNVRNYIQSGNIVFEAGAEPTAVAKEISDGFKSAFGFDSAITLRSSSELTAIINDLPFSPKEINAAEEANSNVEHLYVYFLEDVPNYGEIELIINAYDGPDKLRAAHREIYLLCQQSVRDSKLAVMLGKLGTPMTARNWKTIHKLYEMLNE